MCVRAYVHACVCVCVCGGSVSIQLLKFRKESAEIGPILASKPTVNSEAVCAIILDSRGHILFMPLVLIIAFLAGRIILQMRCLL